MNPTSDGAAPDRPAPRQPSIRRRLLVLVLACVLPTVLMLSSVIGYYYFRELASIKQNTLRSVRAMTQAVDQEFAATTAGLTVLATARLLQRGDVAGFYVQATEVVGSLSIANVMLADSNGRQLMNTLRAFGEPLPPAGDAQLRSIFQTAEPAVGGLFTAPTGGARMISVGVPVMREDQVPYSLNAGIGVDRIQALLTSQPLPEEWLAAVVDNTGTIVARTVAPEKFVGAQPPPLLRARLQQVREDAFESVSLDGVPVLTVFSRSPNTGWTVVIGIPLETLNAELRRSLQWLVGLTLALLVLLLAVTSQLSLVIIRSVRGLVAPAVALGRGEAVRLPKTEFREAAELGAAIDEAAERLQQARQAQARSEDELLKANDALVRSNIDLQQFAFVASHDLRTPLRSIHGYVQMLEKKYGTALGEGGRALVQRVTGAVTQLDQLLQDLLGYARMDAAAKAFAPVDMNEVFNATLHLIDAQIAEAGAMIHSQPLPVVLGDRTQLVQLLQNLLSNSVKYHAPGVQPQVRVSAAPGEGEEAGRWVFAVTDDGIGIDPRYHSSIFEVFKRLHATQEYAGTGIGLALCARIVARHGGRIWVQSREGDGSTFHFSLPRPTPALP